MTTESSLNCNESEWYCNGLGSQPCSCYYSRGKDIMQFELGNDKITRQASSENGTGPASCKDLESIGHALDGYYIIRFNGKIMKTVFCELYRASVEKERENQKISTSPRQLSTTKNPGLPYRV